MVIDWTREKQNYAISLFSISIAGIIGVIFAYIAYLEPVMMTYMLFEDAYTVTLIITIRIVVMGLLSFLIFYYWIRQERPYFDDFPFLMGIFFLSITFGKTLDLLHNLINFTATEEQVIFLLKLRFLLVILAAIPLLYIGFTLIFYIREIPKEKIRKNTLILITIIAATEVLAVFLTANLSTFGILLAIIMFPAILMVIAIFYFSYRQKRLNQVHPLILSIGFTVYLISQVIRPIFQALLIASGAETAVASLEQGVLYVLASEIVSIIASIIIFIGLIRKAKI
ncbi:MAG: hypothetical protein ACTSR8_08920 [Promethearchaeota archaeon]